MTNGLNFLGFLSIGYEASTKQNKNLLLNTHIKACNLYDNILEGVWHWLLAVAFLVGLFDQPEMLADSVGF